MRYYLVAQKYQIKNKIFFTKQHTQSKQKKKKKPEKKNIISASRIREFYVKILLFSFCFNYHNTLSHINAKNGYLH